MRVFLAVTGASGSVYGISILKELLEKGHKVTLVSTRSGRDVTLFETGTDISESSLSALSRRFAIREGEFTIRDENDLFAPEASGSNPPDCMIVAPCSMGTAARIAAGVSGNLIERAADVMIKEKRRLILVPRETPLSPIHLENMLKLARLGVTILPAMPAFYHKPQTIDDISAFIAGKVLDAAGIEHELFRKWGEEKP